MIDRYSSMDNNQCLGFDDTSMIKPAQGEFLRFASYLVSIFIVPHKITRQSALLIAGNLLVAKYYEQL